MKKLILNISPIFLLCLSSLFPFQGTASASNNLTPIHKDTESDFNIISDNLNSLEYTYEEDGEFYKVITKFNIDRTEIHNDVYMKNDSGNYEFVRKSDLIIKEDSAEATIVENEETKSFDLDVNMLNTQKEDIIKEKPSNIIGTYSYADLGPWTYSFSLNIRQDVKGMTRDLIVSTIIGIYYWPAGLAVGAASLIIGANSNAFWVNEKVYLKYIKGTKLPRGDRSVTRIYADKANKHFLKGPHTRDNYTRGWAPK